MVGALEGRRFADLKGLLLSAKGIVHLLGMGSCWCGLGPDFYRRRRYSQLGLYSILFCHFCMIASWAQINGPFIQIPLNIFFFFRLHRYDSRDQHVINRAGPGIIRTASILYSFILCILLSPSTLSHFLRTCSLITFLGYHPLVFQHTFTHKRHNGKEKTWSYAGRGHGPTMVLLL